MSTSTYNNSVQQNKYPRALVVFLSRALEYPCNWNACTRNTREASQCRQWVGMVPVPHIRMSYILFIILSTRYYSSD